jgi:membrane protease YdiL (CAAX protease family)
MTGEESSRLSTQAPNVPVNRAPGHPSDEPIAQGLRAFGPLGILAILVIVAGTLLTPVLGALLVLGWTWRSHTPWRAIGYVRPRNWILGLATGIAFGGAFKLLMKMIVMPLLGADSVNPTYHYVAGTAAALPGVVFAAVFGAGFAEETVYRGYLFERLGRMWGTGYAARMATILVGAGLFGIAHYVDQGGAGVQQAVITGLVFGTVFAMSGQLWMIMCAHAAFDLVAIAIIYLDVETEMAHFVFK